ncbi:CAP domain-containing protein [Arthrobacter sp. B1805]|uniref:CAP domain-containing protein n=1 Tax=Arthrobacter sp. B1805 TaxID=2058892 RepID=UPI000CE3D0F3|nr:CAP domain-containing protein [Arthrobacter sp. B1805]
MNGTGLIMRTNIKQALVAVSTAAVVTFAGTGGAWAVEPAPGTTAPAQSTSTAAVEYTEATAEQIAVVLDRHNAYRASKGLPALAYDARLSRVAQDWSNTMATTGEFKHNPNYSAQIPSGWSAAAENIAANTTVGVEGARQVMTQWINSPGHEANMVSTKFTHIGIGVTNTKAVYDANGVVRYATYATVNFGGYSTSTVVATKPSAATNVRATAGSKSATVTWTRGSDGGSPLTGQTITVYSGTQKVLSGSVSATATSARISNLKPGVAYTVSIIETNKIGSSPESVRSNIVKPLP